jgi:hypothetical protein
MVKPKACKNFSKWIILLPVILFAMHLTMGCATVPYEKGRDIEQADTLKLKPEESKIERGRPIKLIDYPGHYVFSLPSKLLLLNWKIDNHDISRESEEMLQQYLVDNDLHQVKVRLNQYAPGAEWIRLFQNRSVGAGWRFTLGIISLVDYTIIPGRLFGGDHYNPYTNTIHLYSDHKAVLLHEGAHAKDFARRKYKGTYSAIRLLPLVPLYQEAWATGDVLGYYKEKGLIPDEKDAYKVLYPAYCTYIADEGLRWTQWWIDIPIWLDYGIRLGATIPCHIVGRIKALTIDDSTSKPPAETESSEKSNPP